MNKIYHVKYNGEHDIICAPSKSEAIKHCIYESCIEESEIEGIFEILEGEWDTKTITMWEDNDHETEPYQVTYREMYSDCGYCETIGSTVIDY